MLFEHDESKMPFLPLRLFQSPAHSTSYRAAMQGGEKEKKKELF